MWGQGRAGQGRGEARRGGVGWMGRAFMDSDRKQQCGSDMPGAPNIRMGYSLKSQVSWQRTCD